MIQASGRLLDNPQSGTLSAKELAFLLPNIAKLFWRLVRNRRVPFRTRMLLIITGVYLAMPIDIIPDWLPVVGYLDDIVLVVTTLRSVALHVPPDVLETHWDGALPLSDLLARLPALRRRRNPDNATEEAGPE